MPQKLEHAEGIDVELGSGQQAFGNSLHAASCPFVWRVVTKGTQGRKLQP